MEYPKSTAKMKEFFTQRIIKALGAFAEENSDFKMNGGVEITDEQLQSIITYNRRALYDFFDENGVIIVIDHEQQGFIVNIVGEEYDARPYVSREMGENFIFNRAIEVLEKKL